MKRKDHKGNWIGRGEDCVFEMLRDMTGLDEKEHERHFPDVGLYRQVPVSLIYNKDQLENLADYHQKSSVDIVVIWCKDTYLPRDCRFLIRVENKKGDLKMSRQNVQFRYLTEWGHVVDVKEGECPEIFKDKMPNDNTRQELIASFNTARVDIPRSWTK